MTISKVLSSAQSLHEIRLERQLKVIRKWRDQPGKDRAFLMGYNQRVCDPHYIILLERIGSAEPKSHKFRGDDDVGAVERAIKFLEAS